MAKSEKACPIVLRRRADRLDILAFRHPLAGLQLVKGKIDAGEGPVEAALRELHEESGIDHARFDRYLGEVRVGDAGKVWHLVICRADELPERWVHHCNDDGGHDFAFFWHPLDAPLSEDWHPAFKQVLDVVRSELLPETTDDT